MSTNELDITNSRNSRLLADSFSNSRDCDDGDTSNESADENESADLALEAHFQLKSRRSSSHSLINERLSVCSVSKLKKKDFLFDFFIIKFVI
jgi:hypothetical protein